MVSWCNAFLAAFVFHFLPPPRCLQRALRANLKIGAFAPDHLVEVRQRGFSAQRRCVAGVDLDLSCRPLGYEQSEQ